MTNEEAAQNEEHVHPDVSANQPVPRELVDSHSEDGKGADPVERLEALADMSELA